MTGLILTAALKGTVVLAAAWLATALLRRRSADLRHRIWLAALIAMALLLVPVSVPQTLRMTIDAGAAVPGTASAAGRSVPSLTLVWSVLAALLLLRWGAGVLRLFRITRQARSAGLVRVSSRIQTPMTWGVLRPVILVPEYVEDWSAEQRDMVIRHERAHIERRDWLWQGFAQVMTAVFWFHPLVWLALVQIRKEAEHAADDATLATGVQAPDYADRLLAVARQLSGPSTIAGVAMVRRPALTSRIAAILDTARTRSSAGSGARIGVVLAALALMIPLSAFQNRPIYHAGEDGVTPPSVAHKVDPSYTEEAKEAKIQGTVGLSLVVNSQGRADDVKVTQSLETGLDLNAVAAVSQWLFKPGTKDGQPVDVAVKIEVNFRLK
ncbi:MAG TPA: M56 family metallopeptidase [Bryobacteraceae bacterium]|jgi:TonB family protein|nr:M56 family metallopeptidase [Bryobacteraceae bacterium]